MRVAPCMKDRTPRARGRKLSDRVSYSAPALLESVHETEPALRGERWCNPSQNVPPPPSQGHPDQSQSEKAGKPFPARPVSLLVRRETPMIARAPRSSPLSSRHWTRTPFELSR